MDIQAKTQIFNGIKFPFFQLLFVVCLLNALAVPTPASPGSFFNMCFPSIEYLFVQCPVLDDHRKQIHLKLSTSDDMSETAKSLINDSFQSVKSATQMLLDCTPIPAVISAKQIEGPSILHQLFRFSRSWCYTMHKNRLKLVGRWLK